MKTDIDPRFGHFAVFSSGGLPPFVSGGGTGLPRGLSFSRIDNKLLSHELKAAAPRPVLQPLCPYMRLQ
jgi:hypothetical protein